MARDDQGIASDQDFFSRVTGFLGLEPAFLKGQDAEA